MSQSSDRLGQVRHAPGGAVYRFIATCNSTGGSHCALEGTEPPGGGPPLHRHTREDEWFYVLEGELTIWLDGKAIKVPAGSSAFGPRNVPHTFKNCSERPVRYLVVATPGDIEAFFDYGEAKDGRTPTDEQLIQRIMTLAPEYGIEILGPSPL